MSAAQRYVPLFLTAFVGVATGVYVFDPILKQYKEDTHSTFKPEDVDVSKVMERTKQEAREQEERIKAFKQNVEQASGGRASSTSSSNPPDLGLSPELKKDVKALGDQVQHAGAKVEEKVKNVVDESKSVMKGEKDKEISSGGSWWPFSSKK